MKIKLIRLSGLYLMLLGFAAAPHPAMGQASELESKLVSFGFDPLQETG